MTKTPQRSPMSHTIRLSAWRNNFLPTCGQQHLENSHCKLKKGCMHAPDLCALVQLNELAADGGVCHEQQPKEHLVHLVLELAEGEAAKGACTKVVHVLPHQMLLLQQAKKHSSRWRVFVNHLKRARKKVRPRSRLNRPVKTFHTSPEIRVFAICVLESEAWQNLSRG